MFSQFRLTLGSADDPDTRRLIIATAHQQWPITVRPHLTNPLTVTCECLHTIPRHNTVDILHLLSLSVYLTSLLFQSLQVRLDCQRQQVFYRPDAPTLNEPKTSQHWRNTGINPPKHIKGTIVWQQKSFMQYYVYMEYSTQCSLVIKVI